MGSCLSPTIAALVIDDLLDVVLQKLGFKCTFVKTYMDDLCLALPKEKKNHAINYTRTFNEYHRIYSLTMEVENNRILAFLNIVVFVTGMASYPRSIRYISYNSQLPRHILWDVGMNIKMKVCLFVFRGIQTRSIEKGLRYFGSKIIYRPDLLPTMHLVFSEY